MSTIWSARPMSGASSMLPCSLTISTCTPIESKYACVMLGYLRGDAHDAEVLQPLADLQAGILGLGDDEPAAAEAQVDEFDRVEPGFDEHVLAGDRAVSAAVGDVDRNVGGPRDDVLDFGACGRSAGDRARPSQSVSRPAAVSAARCRRTARPWAPRCAEGVWGGLRAARSRTLASQRRLAGRRLGPRRVGADTATGSSSGVAASPARSRRTAGWSTRASSASAAPSRSASRTSSMPTRCESATRQPAARSVRAVASAHAASPPSTASRPRTRTGACCSMSAIITRSKPMANPTAGAGASKAASTPS